MVKYNHTLKHYLLNTTSLLFLISSQNKIRNKDYLFIIQQYFLKTGL